MKEKNCVIRTRKITLKIKSWKNKSDKGESKKKCITKNWESKKYVMFIYIILPNKL